MNNVYADSSCPLPFPSQFKTNANLSINLMNLLSHSERQDMDLTNNVPTINKIVTRTSGNKKDMHKKTDKKWADNIKWEFMPGAV